MRGQMKEPTKATLRWQLAAACQGRANAWKEADALRQQLADCCPELTIRKAALLGMFAGGLLGFAAAWVLGSVL